MDKKKKEEDQIIEENILEEAPTSNVAEAVPEPVIEDQPESVEAPVRQAQGEPTAIIDGADTR